ncbi:GAF domain-containing protein [Streptomonospora nanhaiensis]|uniref:GAF domain-containing protein n=1 Tax=Streptomonospora nanhaiensis TaxID=1323731 RepID=A0A853BXS0_9ACTN|nr:GAF domain-containing protein [Streptomonospora nanhaiensis]
MRAPAADRGISLLAELLKAIVAGDGAADTLAMLMSRTVELIDVSSAGIIVADPRWGLRILAASDERADMADLFQAHHGEGPAAEAVERGGPLAADLRGADDRWPRFGPAARALGYTHVLALPIRLDGQAVGALSLFRGADGRPWGEAEEVAGQVMADLAAITLAQERPGRRAERLAERLAGMLNDRGTIEQAKGALAAHLHCSPEDAYILLAEVAREEHCSVADVAVRVLAGDDGAIAGARRRLSERRRTATEG